MPHIINPKIVGKKIKDVRDRAKFGLFSVAALSLMLAMPANAQAEISKVSEISIEAQTMETALNQLAQTYDKQIIVYSSDAKGISASKIEGVFTEKEALDYILKGSGLTYKYINERTIAVGSINRLTTKASSPKEVSSFRVAQVVSENAENINVPESERINTAAHV